MLKGESTPSMGERALAVGTTAGLTGVAATRGEGPEDSEAATTLGRCDSRESFGRGAVEEAEGGATLGTSRDGAGVAAGAGLAAWAAVCTGENTSMPSAPPTAGDDCLAAAWCRAMVRANGVY